VTGQEVRHSCIGDNKANTQDGKAIVWDTNRLRYTRTLQTPHNEPLLCSAINDSDVSGLSS
jgi:hypothetical protein